MPGSASSPDRFVQVPCAGRYLLECRRGLPCEHLLPDAVPPRRSESGCLHRRSAPGLCREGGSDHSLTQFNFHGFLCCQSTFQIGAGDVELCLLGAQRQSCLVIDLNRGVPLLTQGAERCSVLVASSASATSASRFARARDTSAAACVSCALMDAVSSLARVSPLATTSPRSTCICAISPPRLNPSSAAQRPLCGLRNPV